MFSVKTQHESAIGTHISFPFWASLVAQMVKRLPAMRETQVRSLGWEDPLEKEMATHSSTFAWKISWTEEPGPWGRKESTSLSDFTFTLKLPLISLPTPPL